MNRPKVYNPFSESEKNPQKTVKREVKGLTYKKPTPTMSELIINHCLSHNITSEQFSAWFHKEIKPQLDAEIDHREQERYIVKQILKRKKREKEKPENAIPTAFLGRKAYPNKLTEITGQYTLADWFKVRRKTIEGELDTVLGDWKMDFLTWINGIISQKTEDHPTDEATKKVSALRELIFRRSRQ